MLRLKVIACDVLNREISFLAGQSRCFVDVTFLPQGLHNEPDKLRAELQAAVNKANEGFPYNYLGNTPDYDYIVIGYGLCSNGIMGVSSPKVPLVVPRGHDCMTVLLGSKERYKDYFDHHPGTYWASIGWIERSIQPGEERYNAIYKDYLERYGDENADYLMEMEQGWFREYKNYAHIRWECLGNADFYSEYTKKCAEFLHWSCEELQGDETMLRRVLNGCFEEKEVLIVPPGKKIMPSYDEAVIKAE